MNLPKTAGFRQPAEWERHTSVWLAWPCAADLWEGDLTAAQTEFVALCEAIADVDPGGALACGKQARGEALNILVPSSIVESQARQALASLAGSASLRFYQIPYGDIWLRDTAPVFLRGALGETACVRFAFNGWGEKYQLPHDPEVAARVARAAAVREFSLPWVLEGGSVEVDGEGTCLTSRQCLLNDNRNPDLSQKEIEDGLCEALGVEKILWVGDGLLNDHTDGHIDTIVRYVAPGVVLCMEAHESDDPNREIMARLAAELEVMCDARGRRLRVGRIPSPGRVVDADGEVMPASYLNFYIANTTVVVPTYGSPWDDRAVAAIAEWFPGRRTVGRSAKAILSGGGAFHCISQQQP